MEQLEPYVIGLDMGTTRCKAVALTLAGRVVASAARGYGLHLPRPGWVEQRPDDVWQGVVKTLRALATQCEPRAARALCLSGAMHSLLPLDAKGIPLAPATTWADQRATSLLADLRAQTDTHALYQRTGCPLQASYHPARLRWYQAQAAPHATRYVALKDWVLHQLSAEWATDIGLASTSGLLDIQRLRWDEEALALAAIRAEQLPALVMPQTIVGGLTAEAASAVGWPLALPVVAGTSDGGLANLGA
ncbi:MAG: carbohydrate kinase, partial [Ardenticatenales bacterium]|nr:carbohydrate kinase [Ardenticatenales bacterium]